MIEIRFPLSDKEIKPKLKVRLKYLLIFMQHN